MAHSKINKKTICISTTSAKIACWAESLQILSRFVEAGFDTRQGFFCVVIEQMPEYNSHENLSKLLAFWLKRSNNPNTAKDLSRVLENLKAE